MPTELDLMLGSIVMTRAKAPFDGLRVVSIVEPQSTPSVEQLENIFLCGLGVLAFRPVGSTARRGAIPIVTLHSTRQ